MDDSDYESREGMQLPQGRTKEIGSSSVCRCVCGGAALWAYRYRAPSGWGGEFAASRLLLCSGAEHHRRQTFHLL